MRNINIGTAQVTVTGTGNYAGEEKLSFAILSKPSLAFSTATVSKKLGDLPFIAALKTQITDGEVSYSSSNTSVAEVDNVGKVTIPKNYVGSATITITGGATAQANAITKKITVTVCPKPVKLSQLTNKAGRILKVTWKRNSKVTGYQIEYSQKEDYSSSNKVTIKRNSVTSTRIKKQIKKGKTYYVRIRTYKTVNGKMYYSTWSKTLKRKVVK